MAVLDAASGKVKCSGKLSVGVPGTVYPASLLANALAAAVCPPSSTARSCKSAMANVKPLPPPVVQPKVDPAAAPVVKWAKGMRLEVQRKGKWTRAIILAKAKAGWRIRYEGLSAKLDEVVPESRMRPR